MKVLFVCKSNVKKSQAAMTFYNQLVPGQAASAGLAVGTPGEKLRDRFGDSLILAVMKEYSLDISKNRRTQLTEAIVDGYEQVVVMAVPEIVPKWLSNNHKTVIWIVKDASNGSLEETAAMAAVIKSKVEKLVGQNPSPDILV